MKIPNSRFLISIGVVLAVSALYAQDATLATAAAWSTDPKSPPLYLDLPTEVGQPQPDGLAKWTASAPLAFIDQYVDNLREYHGISIDVGDQDGLRVDASKLHDVLDKYGIEVYEGTHTNKVADRIQNYVIPFFSQNLCFRVGCRPATVSKVLGPQSYPAMYRSGTGQLLIPHR